MLSVLGQGVRLCDGVTRREVLRVGGLAFTTPLVDSNPCRIVQPMNSATGVIRRFPRW